jgi:hypothetical protein
VHGVEAGSSPYSEDAVGSIDELASPTGIAHDDDQELRVWAQADCPNEFGTAPVARSRFGLQAYHPQSEGPYTQEQLDAQRELLAAFARDSAERHGCQDLQLP